MTPGPRSKVGCAGCGTIFRLEEGKQHVLTAPEDSRCRRHGRLDMYVLQEGGFSYLRLSDKNKRLFDEHGIQYSTSEACFIYTILGGGAWRRKYPVHWGFDWAVELANLTSAEADKGEVVEAIKLCRKDAKFRESLRAVIFLSVWDDESRTLFNYDRQVSAKHAALTQHLKSYKK